jgi:TPR repeat protein
MTTALPPLPATAQALAELDPAQWRAVLAAAPAQAAAWMHAAARLGHAEAQAVLGQWLLDGHGLERDPAAALDWFRRAARQGHWMGANMCGRCHEMGWGTAVDPGQAAHWYSVAAANGLPEGKYNLANLHASGKGVAQDPVRAVTLYREAANQGYAKAHGKLGRYFEDGRVVAKDEAAAFRCYEIAAKGGDFRGQFDLAGLLAAEDRHEEAQSWLAQVVAKAPPHYLRVAGEALLNSPRNDYRLIARQMLARADAAANQA